VAKFIGTFLFIFLFLIASPLLPFNKLPQLFIVTSGSMEPLVKSGSLALVKKVSPSSLKVGDIIAFTSPYNSKETILHRIYAFKSNSPLLISTKGDDNSDLDQWDITESAIKGQYIFSLPYLGKFIAFIQKPFGYFIFICFPAIFLVFSELLKIKKIITKNSSPSLLLFLFPLFSLLAISSHHISASYSSKANITGLNFSISEQNPPESDIDLGENFTRNIHHFDINTQAFDDNSVLNIKLYFSHNFSDWEPFSQVICGSEGVFHFDSPAGDGLYSFMTLATDNFGNVEVKEFDYFVHQVKVDTIPPTTNLNNQSFPHPGYSGQNYYNWSPSTSLCDYRQVMIDDQEAFILGSEP